MYYIFDYSGFNSRPINYYSITLWCTHFGLFIHGNPIHEPGRSFVLVATVTLECKVSSNAIRDFTVSTTPWLSYSWWEMNVIDFFGVVLYCVYIVDFTIY